jgi:hypothetical protein
MLTEPTPLLTLDLFTSSVDTKLQQATELRALVDGRAHACLMWVEYSHTEEDGSTPAPREYSHAEEDASGGRHAPDAEHAGTHAKAFVEEATPQLKGIRFWAEPLAVSEGGRYVCTASIHAREGLLTVGASPL